MPKAPKSTSVRGAGLAKPVTPSAELAAIIGHLPAVGPYQTARAAGPGRQAVDPADEALRPIFGKERATMFELAGLIGLHLTA